MTALTEQTEDSSLQEKNQSKAILAFTFNGESFRNDTSLTNESAGMSTIISFGAVSADKNKEVGILFNIENLNLETGVLSVRACTLSLMGFEDSEIGEIQLYAKEDMFLEITSIKKVKSESAMGTTMDEYSISGEFHGDFTSITGGKVYKVENGSFKNYQLVDIRKS